MFECHELNIRDSYEINQKHNLTSWRDPSTLYEHHNEQMNNQSDINGNKFYEKYVSDQYLFSKDLQEEYLLKSPIQYSRKSNEIQSIYTIFIHVDITTEEEYSI